MAELPEKEAKSGDKRRPVEEKEKKGTKRPRPQMSLELAIKQDQDWVLETAKFMQAVLSNDLSTVKEMLRNKDLHDYEVPWARDQDKPMNGAWDKDYAFTNRALCIAIVKGYTEMVRFLLKQQPVINLNVGTVQEDTSGLTQYLQECHGLEGDCTPIEYALIHNQEDIARMCLEFVKDKRPQVYGCMLEDISCLVKPGGSIQISPEVMTWAKEILAENQEVSDKNEVKSQVDELSGDEGGWEESDGEKAEEIQASEQTVGASRSKFFRPLEPAASRNPFDRFLSSADQSGGGFARAGEGPEEEQEQKEKITPAPVDFRLPDSPIGEASFFSSSFADQIFGSPEIPNKTNRMLDFNPHEKDTEGSNPPKLNGVQS